MNNSLLEQIKERRLALELKQHDMHMRVGISRQQYQRLESQGNPRLDTLTLVAQGLNSELMLIPKEKREAVLRVLAGEADVSSKAASGLANALASEVAFKDAHGLALANALASQGVSKDAFYTKDDLQKLLDDPWKDLLGHTVRSVKDRK